MACCGGGASQPSQIGHGFAMGGGVQHIGWVIFDPTTGNYVTNEDGTRRIYTTDNEAYRANLGTVEAVWIT